MAAWDKWQLALCLEKLGWTYHPDHPDDYEYMVPPPGFFEQKSTFHVHEAADLQELFTDWSRADED